MVVQGQQVVDMHYVFVVCCQQVPILHALQVEVLAHRLNSLVDEQSTIAEVRASMEARLAGLEAATCDRSVSGSMGTWRALLCMAVAAPQSGRDQASARARISYTLITLPTQRRSTSSSESSRSHLEALIQGISARLESVEKRAAGSYTGQQHENPLYAEVRQFLGGSTAVLIKEYGSMIS